MSATSTEIERRRSGESRRGEAIPGMGLLKGLGVTIKHLFRKASTQAYPHEQPDLAPRTRGVIGLMDENCTVCMLCARECPDWCIYIDSHKETVPPAREGGRERTRNVLDRFAIDFALCMYCGICIEVCPFDALFWSPRFDYSTYEIDGLLHEKEKLREWMDTVPPPPPLEQGAEPPKEVADALEQAERQLEQAREQRRRELEESESGRAPAQAEEEAQRTEARAEPLQIEGAGEELDQETYDRLIEEGKSERIARAKAKAAWVREQKSKAREAAEADGGEAAGPAPLVDLDLEGVGEELDQQTYDELVEAGSSERVATARAKAVWIREQMQARLQADGDSAEADGEGSAAGDATTTSDGQQEGDQA